MIVYRITKCKYIEDLSGMGANQYGGRWNSAGTYVVYTADSPALALLETIVHLYAMPKENHCLLTLEIPDDAILEISAGELPESWNSYPAAESLKSIGDKFVKDRSFLALRIPSAVMAEENTILINPAHPDFKKIRKISLKNIPFDTRLLKK